MDSIYGLPSIALGAPLEDGSPGSVELWCYHYDDHTPDSLWRAYAELMAPEERARHARLHFERDRVQFLATRALVRCVLSNYVPDVSPRDWRFSVDGAGKPFVAQPTTSRPIHFNLSNTHGLVVCAVSRACGRIGVDVEAWRREVDFDVATTQFAGFERAALLALPSEARQQRFFAYWTLKESYIKARGLGLALPLEQCGFILDGYPIIRVALDARLGDDASVWRFALVAASSRHVLALAADTGGAALDPRAVSYVPLLGAAPFASRGTLPSRSRDFVP